MVKTTNPLSIHMIQGEVIKSTHEGLLDIPWLPLGARKVHVVPDLVHSSLVSIRELCKAECQVKYNGDCVKAIYDKKVVWRGVKEPTTDLWVLPLHQGILSPEGFKNPTKELAANAFQMTSRESLVKFLRLFSPPKRTLVKALKNGQFPTWPFNKEAVEN